MIVAIREQTWEGKSLRTKGLLEFRCPKGEERSGTRNLVDTFEKTWGRWEKKITLIPYEEDNSGLRRKEWKGLESCKGGIKGRKPKRNQTLKKKLTVRKPNFLETRR